MCFSGEGINLRTFADPLYARFVPGALRPLTQDTGR